MMLRRLLLRCAGCYFRMSFQALLGNAQSLLVQLGLLGHVPDLRDYYRPENQQGDRRRDRLLTENPYPCFYPAPVCLRLYLYVQGSLQTYDGLEGASPANADLHPSSGDVRFGHLEVLLLKVTHHVLSDGSEVLYNVGNGVRRIESPHLKCLLTYEGRCPCLILPAAFSQHPLLRPPLLRDHGSGLQTLHLQGVEHGQLAQRLGGEGFSLR